MKTKINLNYLSIGLLIFSTIGFMYNTTSSTIIAIISLLVAVFYGYKFYIRYNEIHYKLHFTEEELAKTKFKLTYQLDLVESNKKILSASKRVITSQELLLIDYQKDVNKLTEVIKIQKETISRLESAKENNWLDYNSGM